MRSSFLPVVLAISLGAGCRTASGPAGPDASAIVDGTAGPGVRTDTIDAPFSVALDKARWRSRDTRDASRDFWNDVDALDIVNAERAASSLEERTFVVALRQLMASDPEAATVAFSALHRNAHDPMVRSRSRVGLTMALTWFSDWAAIANIGGDPDSANYMIGDPRTMQSGVERWARAFSGIPVAKVLVPEVPITVPLRRSAFGTPVVEVRINGRPHEFWLDTGASMTLLSADVAIEAGVRLAANDTLALGVVGGHIDARAIFVDSLSIGSFSAQGITAAVVDRSKLRLDHMQVNGVARAVPIDGVIGTDLLRYMDLVIDAAAGTITIGKPRRGGRAVRNLFWVGYPVVRLVSRDGRPLLFGLDTGAEGTYVTTSLLRKLPRTQIAARRGQLNGLGSEMELTRWVARDVAVSDGDYAILLRNTPVAPERRWTFVTFDGVIGSDIALGTRLHLDFENGVFDVRPSSMLEGRSGIQVKVTPD